MSRLYQTTFDELLADKLRLEGMDLAATSRSELLILARRLAERAARRRASRLCSADDVQRQLIELGFHPEDLGNAAGSIFRGPSWEWTGDYTKSERVSSHRNLLKVWRLRDER